MHDCRMPLAKKLKTRISKDVKSDSPVPEIIMVRIMTEVERLVQYVMILVFSM